MSDTAFQSILHDLNSFTYAQLKKLHHETDKRISKNQVGQVIAEREEEVAACPHCESEDKNRWGMTAQGVQRYKCKSCRKTYNALAGTPLYRMRKPEKWVLYGHLMWHGTSLRKSAKHLDINLKTSFRWRHTFLTTPSSVPITELTGVIEADETYIKESHKGERNMTGKPRKRGKSKMYKDGNITQVPVAIAMNRDGAIAHQVLKRKTKKEIQGFVRPLLTAGSILCTDANPSYNGVTDGLNVDHKQINNSQKEHSVEGIYHIQTLNNYMMNLENWMYRFRGVATKYLPRYLAWYRFMKQHEDSDQVWLRSAL